MISLFGRKSLCAQFRNKAQNMSNNRRHCMAIEWGFSARWLNHRK